MNMMRLYPQYKSKSLADLAARIAYIPIFTAKTRFPVYVHTHLAG